MASRQAYLDWEALQPDKHEFLAGEVFARVGVRRAHSLAAGAIHARLRSHLEGSRCDTFVSDMNLFVADADPYFYPDVMVTCDERDRHAELAIEHPRLVVEVLSESTAAYDRGIKFAAYRKLADLQEYLLVDVDQRRLELYRREPEHWILLESEGDGPALPLQSVGMTLSPAQAFEDLGEEA